MFNSDLRDERVKGFIYAREPERMLVISDQEVHFNGRHATHVLRLNGAGWACDCAKFNLLAKAGLLLCAHVVAVERVLAVLK